MAAVGFSFPKIDAQFSPIFEISGYELIAILVKEPIRLQNSSYLVSVYLINPYIFV